MNKTKLLATGLVLLVLLNAVSLFFLFRMQKNPEQKPVVRGGEGPGNYIVEQLRLDETQQKQFADLRRQHQEFARKTHDEGKKLHDAYFSFLKTDNPDKTKVDSLASLIAANQKQLELFTFDHFQKIRAFCHEDQKKLFDETIDDIAKMVGGGPPGPPGPPR